MSLPPTCMLYRTRQRRTYLYDGNRQIWPWSSEYIYNFTIWPPWLEPQDTSYTGPAEQWPGGLGPGPHTSLRYAPNFSLLEPFPHLKSHYFYHHFYFWKHKCYNVFIILFDINRRNKQQQRYMQYLEKTYRWRESSLMTEQILLSWLCGETTPRQPLV